MERSSKRGKIPQQDWPSIMARHAAGETLASIARTYDCSPPAISYIVSRSRARNQSAEAAGHAAAPAAEPQLVKAHAPEPAPVAASEWRKPAESHPAPALVGTAPPRIDAREEAQKPGPGLVAERGPLASDPRVELRARDGNGSGRYFPGQPGPDRSAEAADSRPTLRLPLASGSEQPHHPPPPVQRPPVQQGFAAPPRPQASGNPAPVRVLPEPPKNREGGAIDAALRERVAADIAVFLEAFDTALAQDTPETRGQLREATDRLLRAGARTRIELERLEARVPLPARERERERYDQDAVAWRQR